MLERTINNAPTSNTKQAAMNGDWQHMLQMMQDQQAAANSALKAGDINHYSAMTTAPVSVATPNPTTAAKKAGDMNHILAMAGTPVSVATPKPAEPVATAPTTTSPSPAVSTTQTKTEQAVAPAVTIPTRQVNSYEQYVNDMYEAERQAALSALEAEYAAAIGELERQKAAISPMYQNARNQTAGVNARETQAMNEMLAAAGLSSGGRAQGAIAQSNVLQSELGALQQAEAQALAEIESQRTQVSAQYQARVREAIMNNEMQKAAALYEEAIRYDNELVKAAKEAAASREDMAKTMASIGDFSGYAALGYTPDQIAALEAAYIKANTPKYTGTPVKKEPTLSLSDAKALAEMGDLSDNVIAALRNGGYTDANLEAMYGYAPQAAGTPTVETPTTAVQPLRNNSAISLYGMVKNGLMDSKQAALILNDYIANKQIDNDEAEYILSAMGY